MPHVLLKQRSGKINYNTKKWEIFNFIQHDLECLLNELLQYLPTEYSNRLKLFWWV